MDARTYRSLESEYLQANKAVTITKTGDSRIGTHSYSDWTTYYEVAYEGRIAGYDDGGPNRERNTAEINRAKAMKKVGALSEDFPLVEFLEAREEQRGKIGSIIGLDYDSLEETTVDGKKMYVGTIKEGKVYLNEDKEPEKVVTATQEIEVGRAVVDDRVHYGLRTGSESRGRGYGDTFLKELNTENAIVVAYGSCSHAPYIAENHYVNQREYAKEVGELSKKYDIPFTLALTVGRDEDSYKRLNEFKEAMLKGSEVDNYELGKGISRRKEAIRQAMVKAGFEDLYKELGVSSYGQTSSGRLSVWIGSVHDQYIANEKEKTKALIPDAVNDVISKAQERYGDDSSIAGAFTPAAIEQHLSKCVTAQDLEQEKLNLLDVAEHLSLMNDRIKKNVPSLITMFLSDSNIGAESAVDKFFGSSAYSLFEVSNGTFNYRDIVENYLVKEYERLTGENLYFTLGMQMHPECQDMIGVRTTFDSIYREAGEDLVKKNLADIMEDISDGFSAGEISMYVVTDSTFLREGLRRDFSEAEVVAIWQIMEENGMNYETVKNFLEDHLFEECQSPFQTEGSPVYNPEFVRYQSNRTRLEDMERNEEAI